MAQRLTNPPKLHALSQASTGCGADVRKRTYSPGAFHWSLMVDSPVPDRDTPALRRFRRLAQANPSLPVSPFCRRPPSRKDQHSSIIARFQTAILSRMSEQRTCGDAAASRESYYEASESALSALPIGSSSVVLIRPSTIVKVRPGKQREDSALRYVRDSAGSDV